MIRPFVPIKRAKRGFCTAGVRAMAELLDATPDPVIDQGVEDDEHVPAVVGFGGDGEAFGFGAPPATGRSPSSPVMLIHELAPS